MSIKKIRIQEIINKAKELEWKSLSEIAKENSIKIVIIDLTELWEISWIIMKSDDWNYKIYINSTENERRQRFTLAHELWHYFFHKNFLDEKKWIIDNKSQYLFRSNIDIYGTLAEEIREMEEEANLFAAELLMPENKVKQLWWKIDNIKDLADIFEVSNTAMSYRLDNLNLN